MKVEIEVDIILERLRIPCTDRSCEDCDADRIDAAEEIERLRVYEAAVASMARQFLEPETSAYELANNIIAEEAEQMKRDLGRHKGGA